MQRLSIGTDGALRTVGIAGCLVLAVIGAAAAAISLRTAAEMDALAQPGPVLDGTEDTVTVLADVTVDVLRFVAGFAVIVALGAVYLLIRTVRRAAWLDGTRLSVRGAVFTNTVDLAIADASLHLGVLRAQDPGRGRRVRLAVRALPPYEVAALARATANAAVAQGLRATAAQSHQL